MSQLIDRAPSHQRDRQLVHANDSSDESQRFLGFTIGNNLNALIPLVDLQATIKITLSEILPVPQMQDSLLGIINYGGKATWVVDLAHLMGGSSYLQTQDISTSMGLLFRVQNEIVALSIDRVGTIETYKSEECLSIGEAMFTDRMRSFLAGYFIDESQQSRVVVDLDRVIHSLSVFRG
ncbi:chemotaxis protein CheW [Chamaesiphon sp. VAR_48_metabat_135_sub]|uniref:chemotaxis protein CheW n=1 Tax=Chamaesiphon sp. VAR_48_metabat_135_sub TaxID=2964699 RepID=UPI00286A0354|nr:chemotaxis protein CheW [Chamaesiphon sp. VAR_48_metabat_135_sub]